MRRMKKWLIMSLSIWMLYLAMIPATAYANESASYVKSDVVMCVGEQMYSVEEAYEYTVFEFKPTEAGAYTFMSEFNMGIVSYNGMWITVEPSETSVAEKILTWECTAVGQEIWIAVQNDSSSVNIEVQQGAVETEKTETIEYHNVVELKNYVNASGKFVLTGDVSKLKYVSPKDGVVSQAVLGTDAYYHLDTVDGPILYVNLTDDRMNLSTANSLGQLKGANIEDGEVTALVDFYNAFSEYAAIADDDTVSGKTFVPLTDDLKNLLQSVGFNPNNGWYDPESSFCVGSDEDAWMFLCFYIEGEASHSYKAAVTAPTCEKQGYTTYSCVYCGDSYNDDYVNATGHTYGAWKTTKAATCTTEGTKRHDCKNCDSYVTEKIAKLDHSKKTTVTKATLSKNGKKVTKCTACDEVFKTVTIYKVSSVKLSYTKTTYNGKVKTPSVTVKDTKGNVLKKGTDYTVKYEDGRKSTGEYTVTIKFKGNYSGTKERTFKILPAATSKVTAASTKTTLKATWKKVTGATGYKVELLSSSGKAVKKPVYTIKLNTTFTGLTKATTYKIKVTAYKTIDGDKICSLSSKTLKTATAPDKASLKVTAGTKKATLSWSKETCSGYEIVYDTNSKFSSPDKTVTISKSSTVKTTIKNLKKGKTYYFKIRAYKLVDGVKVYSENSNVVKVKIK